MEDIGICQCNIIMKIEIVKAIKVKGLKTVEEVHNENIAGTTFGGFIPDIEDIFEEANKRNIHN